MKIYIKKSILESIVNLCSSCTDKEEYAVINSHLLFEAKENELFIKANNLDMGLEYKIKEVKIENQGFATANAKDFIDIIRNLDDDTIILETIENSLFIKQKSTKYKVPMFKDEEFPKFPSINNNEKFNINSNNLIRSLKKTLPAVDNNNMKPSLNGILIDIKKDKINFVSSDTKRMALLQINEAQEKEFSLIIPKKSIIEIEKIINNKVEIYYDENILIIKNDDFYFFTKLINDKFPDYERVIPKQKMNHNFRFKTDDFTKSLKKMSMMDKVELHINKNKIEFLGEDTDGKEAKTELETDLNIEEKLVLKFKIKYLLDFLNSIEDEEFELQINEENMPFMVLSEELKTIIMPTIL